MYSALISKVTWLLNCLKKIAVGDSLWWSYTVGIWSWDSREKKSPVFKNHLVLVAALGNNFIPFLFSVVLGSAREMSSPSDRGGRSLPESTGIISSSSFPRWCGLTPQEHHGIRLTGLTESLHPPVTITWGVACVFTNQELENGNEMGWCMV